MGARRSAAASRTAAPPTPIAGVVANSLYESFGEPPTPIIYLSYRDRPSIAGEIHLRTRAGGETLLAPAVRRVVRDVDPSLPVYDVRTLTEHVEKNLVLRRIPARMFVVLGPLLLVLAAIGIYAVVAYTRGAAHHRRSACALPSAPRPSVSSRRLSARVCASSSWVRRSAGWWCTSSTSISRLARPVDPLAFAGVPALLMLVGAIASWIPARRASDVDPMVSLRQE